MLLTIGILLLTAGTAEDVNVRSDHAQVLVDQERYRLVSARSPLIAVVGPQPAGSEIVIEVVRLGSDNEPLAGAVPLVVTVDKSRNVFPIRPALVRDRTATWAGKTGVASFPVRYPLTKKLDKSQQVRVALLRPDRGGIVGVKVTVNAAPATTLAELDRSAGGRFEFPALDARRKATKKATKKSSRRRGAKRIRIAKRSTDERGSDGSDTSATPTVDARVDAGPGSGEDGANREEPDDHSTNEDSAEDKPDGSDANADGEGATQDAGPPVGEDVATDQVVDAGALPASTTGDESEDLTTGRFKVVLRNEMGTFFALQERTVIIDGVIVHKQRGTLPFPRTIAFEREIEAGSHTLEVRMSYLGDGGLLFQYLNGYTFHVNDQKRVQVPIDGALTVVVTGVESGGPFAELTDKPGLRWDYERPD